MPGTSRKHRPKVTFGDEKVIYLLAYDPGWMGDRRIDPNPDGTTGHSSPVLEDLVRRPPVWRFEIEHRDPFSAMFEGMCETPRCWDAKIERVASGALLVEGQLSACGVPVAVNHRDRAILFVLRVTGVFGG
jgi:hypothetical protein